MFRPVLLKKWRILICCLFFWLLTCNQVMADGDIRITVNDPTREGVKGNYEATVTYEALSAPSLSYGDNRVLGTLRIKGKENIKVPIEPGQKIQVTLPLGTCYMQVPNDENFRNYVEWPVALDGLMNQIKDSNEKSAVKFISATPRSLIVEIENIDTNHSLMALDFVFDQLNYSRVKVSRLIEVSDLFVEYANEPVTRLYFFQMLRDITLPFSTCPADLSENDDTLQQKFLDVQNISPLILKKIKPLVDSGIISGDGNLLRPNDYITRIEAATMLGRLFPQNNEKAYFQDEIPAGVSDQINTLVVLQIIKGYPDGTFKPDQKLTKLEMLNMLQRTLESYPVKSL